MSETESNRNVDWTGDALTEEFTINSSELEEAVENREEWRDEIDIRYWENDGYQVVEIAPTAKDAKNNSDSSGDYNILHNDSEVVEEFLQTYGFTRNPEQGGEIVVSQGMSVVDALADKLDRPVEEISGEWQKMTYAPEGEEPADRLLAAANGDGEFEMGLLPGGDYDQSIEEEVGSLEIEYTDNPEQYQEEHNTKITSLKDLAVGRGFKTHNQIRNGELLIENETTANKPVDWDEAEAYTFNLEEVEENGPQVTATWNIDVRYSDGEVSEDALTYEETSMYTQDFENLDNVQDYLN